MDRRPQVNVSHYRAKTVRTVKDIVTRAISGHATEGMQRLYSTVHAV